MKDNKLAVLEDQIDNKNLQIDQLKLENKRLEMDLQCVKLDSHKIDSFRASEEHVKHT